MLQKLTISFILLTIVAQSLAATCDNPMIADLGLVSSTTEVDLTEDTFCYNVSSKSCCTADSLNELFASFDSFKEDQKNITDESMKSVAMLLGQAQKLSKKAQGLKDVKTNNGNGNGPEKNQTGTGNTTQPSGNGTQPSGNGTQPSGNGTQPSGNGTQPSGNGTQPLGNGTQTSGNTTQSSGNSTESDTTEVDYTYDTTYEDAVLAINDTFPDINATVEDYKNLRAKCYQTLNKHKAGMNCLACSVDWANYITINDDGSYTVSLDVATCDLAQEACGDYFALLADLQKIAEAISYVNNTSPSKPSPGKPVEFTTNTTMDESLIDTLTKCTDSDCQAVCDQIITIDGASSTPESTLELIVDISEEDVEEDEEDTTEEDEEDATEEDADSGIRMLAKTELRTFRRLASEASIVYTENGYDSVDAGDTSGADVTVDISGEPTVKDEENGSKIKSVCIGALLILFHILFNQF